MRIISATVVILSLWGCRPDELPYSPSNAPTNGFQPTKPNRSASRAMNSQKKGRERNSAELFWRRLESHRFENFFLDNLAFHEAIAAVLGEVREPGENRPSFRIARGIHETLFVNGETMNAPGYLYEDEFWITDYQTQNTSAGEVLTEICELVEFNCYLGTHGIIFREESEQIPREEALKRKISRDQKGILPPL